MTDILPPIVTLDGREARATHHRTLMIEAGLRLIVHKGKWQAPAKDVAAEAGVSLRTFFNHFTTMEYYREILLSTYKEDLLVYVLRFDTPEKILKELMK